MDGLNHAVGFFWHRSTSFESVQHGYQDLPDAISCTPLSRVVSADVLKNPPRILMCDRCDSTPSTSITPAALPVRESFHPASSFSITVVAPEPSVAGDHHK